MKVRNKLILMTLFVAVVPLAMSASQTIRLHEEALDATLLELHASAATLGASAVAQYLAHAKSALESTAVDTIDWEALTAEERGAALWLLFGQFESSGIATLSRSGSTLSQAYLKTASPASFRHPVLSDRDSAEFERVAPPAGPEVRTGAPMRTEAGDLLLPLSVRDAPRAGSAATQVSLGLGLCSLCQVVGEARPTSGEIVVVDRLNRKVCDNSKPGGLEPVDASLAEVLSAPTQKFARASSTGPLRGAIAASADGFRVVAEQPESVLTAPSRRLRWRAIFWLGVGVLAAVASGLLLSRGIVTPLLALHRASRKIAEGDLASEVQPQSRRDELGELAASFNTMSRAIAERDAEIQRWNATLQERVDRRGRELEEARGALLRSQKMAGLAVATAGVAHEMNNPLTGVLGLSQILASRFEKKPAERSSLAMLRSIVEEARRMQALLSRMQSLGANEEDTEVRDLSLSSILDGVLLAFRHQLTQQGVEVIKDYDRDLRVLGDPYQVHAVFVELIENSLAALSSRQAEGSRRIELRATRREESDWVEVTVSDNGPGIEARHLGRVFEPFYTTKPGGRGAGLGLSRVYRMLESVGGRVDVESEPNVETRVCVRLPPATSGALLA